MNLNKLDKKGLRKACDDAGVTWDKTQSEGVLRKHLQAHIDKKPKNGDGKKVPWDSDTLHGYYTAIVKQEPPNNDAKAYQHLLRVIDDQVKQADLQYEPDGKVACFGIGYDPITYPRACGAECGYAPACKAVCEKRPELAKFAKALDIGQAELEKMTGEELAELERLASKRPGQKKEKPAKAKKVEAVSEKPAKVLGTSPKKASTNDSASYLWVGDEDFYLDDADLDQDFRAIIEWMVARKKRGFTVSELRVKVAESYDDAEGFTTQVIDMLLEAEHIEKGK